MRATWEPASKIKNCAACSRADAASTQFGVMRKAPWQPLEVWWAWADVLGQLVVGELRADRVLARWA